MTMKAHIDIELPGGWVEVVVDVEADYQPEEDQTHDYPGCAESIEVCSIVLGGADILDDLSEAQVECISDQALEHERSWWKNNRMSPRLARQLAEADGL